MAVVGMAFGMFMVLSVRAVAANFSTPPFSNASLLWMVVVEVMLAISAITFLYMRGFAVSTLLPTPNLKGTAVGVALFFAAWVIGELVSAPFAAGLPQQPIEAMIAEARVTLQVIVVMAMINGTFEEVFLLGFLLRGLRGYGLSIAVGITLLVRVLCHLYQGPVGPIWVMGVGITFAVYYIRSTQLWPPVFAHILWDIVPFAYA
jgi:membrane protease YdiL (CAAX protease family)